MITKIPCGQEVATVSKKSKPAADKKKATQEPQPAPKDENNKEKRDPRLAMTLQEAEIIAQNLKESGTRR
jgi:hypothetical protein